MSRRLRLCSRHISMRSKLPAQRPNRPISRVITRLKFLPHPNPSSKPRPRAKNQQASRPARNPARTAPVDAAAAVVVDAAGAVAVANRQLRKPSLQPRRKALFPRLAVLKSALTLWKMRPKKMESDQQLFQKPHPKAPGPEHDLHRMLRQPCPRPRRDLLRAS